MKLLARRGAPGQETPDDTDRGDIQVPAPGVGAQASIRLSVDDILDDLEGDALITRGGERDCS